MEVAIVTKSLTRNSKTTHTNSISRLATNNSNSRLASRGSRQLGLRYRSKLASSLPLLCLAT
jgi:hypothetical protein